MKHTTVASGMRILAAFSLLSAAVLHAESVRPAQTAPAESSPAESRSTEAAGDPIETLTQGQLQEAFRVLSQHYIETDALTYDQLNKAALEGLMRRLSFGAELMPRESTAKKDEVPFAFHDEVLDKAIAYIRPVTFNQEEISKTESLLKKHSKNDKIHTLILDLRAPVEQFEFARAAAFADFFTGRNELLFKIQKPTDSDARLFLSKEANLWEKRLILLIDRETSSVAETVAAVIDQQATCFIVGERTPGRAVQYQEIPLNKDTNLRFASAEVLLREDKALFRKGVAPDLVSATSSKRKRRIFEGSEENGLAKYAYDKERPRMNEAALVAGTDPELEYYLVKSAGDTSPFDRKPLQDRTLQTALESLIAIDFLKLPEEKKKKKKKAKKKEDPESPAKEKEKEKDGEDQKKAA